MARNPKDVIVSYYHYHRLLEFHQFTGDLEAFAEYFITDKGRPIYLMGFQLFLLDILIPFVSNSLQCPVLPSFAGRMEQKASSKYALCILRGSQEGKLRYFTTAFG